LTLSVLTTRGFAAITITNSCSKSRLAQLAWLSGDSYALVRHKLFSVEEEERVQAYKAARKIAAGVRLAAKIVLSAKGTTVGTKRGH